MHIIYTCSTFLFACTHACIKGTPPHVHCTCIVYIAVAIHIHVQWYVCAYMYMYIYVLTLFILRLLSRCWHNTVRTQTPSQSVHPHNERPILDNYHHTTHLTQTLHVCVSEYACVCESVHILYYPHTKLVNGYINCFKTMDFLHLLYTDIYFLLIVFYIHIV